MIKRIQNANSMQTVKSKKGGSHLTVTDLLPVINAEAIRIYQRERLLYDGLAVPNDLLSRTVTTITPDGSSLEISIKA